MNSVAERVTYAREKRGLKKSELAEKADVSTGYLTQLESPREGASIKHPGVEILNRMASALRVPFTWLAFGTAPEPTWDDEPSSEESSATGTGG
jgi:transcriptional regulator with XRE-family HTH domain